jgi:hypothetical protein
MGNLMARDSFSLFCQTCNLQVDARSIARGLGGFQSASDDPFDGEIETEYHGDAYLVAICPKCDSPFLLKQSRYTVLGDSETVTREDLIYPTPGSFPLGGVPEPVRRAFEQAHRSFATSSFDACALMCRRSLEALCKSFGVEGKNLDMKLKALAERKIIEARLVGWAHGIRHVGNEAAHDTDSEVSKEDAQYALDFTEALLTYVFVLNQRFEIFSLRRANRTREPT